MRGRLLRLTAELRRKHAEAEAVLGGIAEGVFAVDRERRIRYVNPQAAAMLEVRADEAIGRFCGDVLRPQGAGGARPCEESCPILHARFRGGARAVENLDLPGGGRRSVVITSAPPERGDVAGAAAGGRQFQVVRDETEVEAARRLRDAVLANISHEFRTPLAAQLASIELLRERLEDPASETAQLVLSLERGTLRLTRLIDNLLESVRIEAGEDSIRMRRVALDEVIEHAALLTAPLIGQKSQRLTIDLPYPLPPVMGDATRLAQVFVNLLANANKFAPAGTAVSIGGMVGEAEITLWVQDEGPGLSSEDGELPFGRFVRLPEPGGTQEPEASGMGLGLWIVKSIVTRHGGRVEARAAENAAGRSGAPASDGSASGDRPAGTRMCVVLPRAGNDEDSGR